jgi:hypothetical protein
MHRVYFIFWSIGLMVYSPKLPAGRFKGRNIRATTPRLSRIHHEMTQFTGTLLLSHLSIAAIAAYLLSPNRSNI